MNKLEVMQDTIINNDRVKEAVNRLNKIHNDNKYSLIIEGNNIKLVKKHWHVSTIVDYNSDNMRFYEDIVNHQEQEAYNYLVNTMSYVGIEYYYGVYNRATKEDRVVINAVCNLINSGYTITKGFNIISTGK